MNSDWRFQILSSTVEQPRRFSGVFLTSLVNPSPPDFFFVIEGPETVTTVVPVGPNPTHMICPYCHAEIDTTTKSVPGLMAYISSAVLCIVGCFLGCCLIPCCIEICMDVSHTCPNCDRYLGTFKR